MDTRTQIITLAIRQLKNGGYVELNFGDIASELGVSRANIHHHFANKENLARVALTQYQEDDFRHMIAMMEKYPNDFPKVLNATDEYFEELFSAHPGEGICACSPLLLSTSDVPSSLKALSTDYFGKLSALWEVEIKRSQKAGTVRESVNARDLAWECISLMIGIAGLSGVIEADGFVHHPVRRLFQAKAAGLV